MKNHKFKKKRKGHSCIEERPRREFNTIEHVKRWGRNMKHMYQRIKYGYCERDVWSIDWWFLSVVPYMIEDLRDEAHGYPDGLEGISQALVGTGASEEVDNAGMQRWKDVLTEMAFLFKEAHEETCTRENPYDEEWSKVQAEFDKKYGFFGGGLKTEKEKAEEKKKSILSYVPPRRCAGI